MKKIILPIIVCLFALSNVNATENLNLKKNPVEKLENTVNKLCDFIKKGDYESVKDMLEKGQKVNETHNGLTPLMFAARYDRPKIAKLLIGFGADKKAVSENGKLTALKLARISKAEKTYYIIKKAIDKEAKEKC